MLNAIELPVVEKLSLNFKEGKVKISFETVMKPAEIARLINFARQAKPLNAEISSPQAMMDLKIEEVSLYTGEVLAAR